MKEVAALLPILHLFRGRTSDSMTVTNADSVLQFLNPGHMKLLLEQVTVFDWMGLLEVGFS